MTFLSKYTFEPFDWLSVTEIDRLLDKYPLSFKDGKAVLELDLPGVAKEDVKISLENQQVAIQWSRKGQKYSRAWVLHKEIDETKSTATLKDGVLTVSLYETTRHQRTIRVD